MRFAASEPESSFQLLLFVWLINEIILYVFKEVSKSCDHVHGARHEANLFVMSLCWGLRFLIIQEDICLISKILSKTKMFYLCSDSKSRKCPSDSWWSSWSLRWHQRAGKCPNRNLDVIILISIAEHVRAKKTCQIDWLWSIDRVL
jgi:hypothetical protein